MRPRAESVEVLIPTWNGRERLRRALASLLEQTHVPGVCVVDNGSADGTGAMLAADFPEVRVVRLESNHGFGPALNRGVEGSDAELIAFLNDDAVANSRFVERLVRRREETGAEMVAGVLVDPAGVVETAGVAVDRSLEAYDLCHGIPYPPEPGDLAGAEPLAPCAGAGAYERRAFLAAGGFDEEIFAYLEDVELGLRMRGLGMGCALAAEAFAVHEHSATLGGGSAAKNELLGRNRGYLLWKHGAGLPRSARIRGLAIDATIAAGKLVIDRDLGFVRGRVGARRANRRRKRPPANPALPRVPMLEVGLVEALRFRLARRRPPRGR